MKKRITREEAFPQLPAGFPPQANAEYLNSVPTEIQLAYLEQERTKPPEQQVLDDGR